MRYNCTIKKLISVLLIIVLMHKTGGGLFFHNWFHSQTNIAHSSKQFPGIEKKVAGCTCADDFYLAFVDTPEPVTQIQPVIQYEFVVPHSSPIPFIVTFFHSLRGPPALVA